jgi:type I restriction enzyme, S subunit
VWRGGEAVLNQHIFRVDFDEATLDKRFFRYAINQKLDELIDIAHGGVGLRHVTKGTFERTLVAVPPLNEQKRIADKLGAVFARVDACRERLDRVPAILKRFRQAVLAAATSGKLTEEWREETKPSVEWRHTTVGSLLADIRYGTAKKCLYEPKKTPVLRIPNILDGRVKHDDMKYAEFEKEEFRKLVLAAGDILMIRSNGSLGLVGRIALVTEREEGFVYAGYLIRLRVNQAFARPAYLSISLESPESRNAIEHVARSTSGVNNINTEEIKALAISLPGVDEQDEIVHRVEALFAYADRLEARYTAARAQVERLTPALLGAAGLKSSLSHQRGDAIVPSSTMLTMMPHSDDSSSVARSTANLRSSPFSFPKTSKRRDSLLTIWKLTVSSRHCSC